MTSAARTERTAGELMELWAEPDSAATLIAYWMERDRRYSIRKSGRLPHPLSGPETVSVIAARRADIERLPALDRARAWQELNRWMGRH